MVFDFGTTVGADACLPKWVRSVFYAGIRVSVRESNKRGFEVASEDSAEGLVEMRKFLLAFSAST